MGTLLAIIFCVVIGFPMVFGGILILALGVVGISAAAWSWRAARRDDAPTDIADTQCAAFLPLAVIGGFCAVSGVALMLFVASQVSTF